jgi:hypothetical protein
MTAPYYACTRFAFWATAMCLLGLLVAPRVIAGEVQASRPWRYSVYADKLPGIDDIARRNSDVYVTQDQANGGGRVLRLRGATPEIVADELLHPRGLLLKKQLLYVTEQAEAGRVTEINLLNRRRRVIESLANPEHLAKLPDGDILVTESSVNGRLVRLLANGSVEVVTGGLNNPEGLSVGHDGTVFIGESGTGRVLAYKDGALDVVVDDLDELGQIEATPDGALWISEDGNPGRLLRLKDGALETVLTNLKDPRGIAALDGGAVLVVEHGRARVLLVEPRP